MTVYSGPAHEAAKLLGEISPGSPTAGLVIDALTSVVRSATPQRRSSAAEALGEFGPSAAAAIPDLAQMLQAVDPPGTSTPTRTAESAAGGLAQIAASTDGPRTQEAVAALKSALSAESKNTQPPRSVRPDFGPKPRVPFLRSKGRSKTTLTLACERRCPKRWSAGKH